MEDPRKKVFRIDKPWGFFEQYTHNQKTTVKIWLVKKGQRLSLQSHEKRDEMWVPLDDGFEITMNGKKTKAKPFQTFFCPRKTKHSVASLKKDAKLLEICFGNFDERDIKRYKDEYGREGSNEII